MLGKLLKYDFKNLLLPCLPLYVGGIILAIIGNFLIGFSGEPIDVVDVMTSEGIIHIFSSLSISLIFFGITCIILFSLALVATDFYHTVFGKRGYLTHTLPVSSKDMLLSKFISGFVSLFISTAIAIILYYVISIGNESSPSDFTIVLGESLINITEPLGRKLIIYILVASFFLTIFSTIYGVVTIYLSVALGHLTKYKIGGSIAIFCILSNIVSSILVIPSGILIVFEITKTVENMYPSEAIIVNPTILYCVLVSIASAIYYFVVRKIMDNKLNLV